MAQNRIVIPDVIETLLNDPTLREQASITSITSDGNDKYTVLTSDTKTLTDGNYINIGDVKEIVVSSLISDTSFVVTSTTALDLNSSIWYASSPYYFHGTPLKINEELKHRPFVNDSSNIAVFLFEVISEERNVDEGSAIYTTPTLEKYFMKHCDAQDWTTNEHYENAINETDTLLEDYIDVLEDRVDIVGENFTTFNKTKYPDWGTFLANKGFSDRILNQKFSGTGLFIQLPIIEQNDCTI